LRIGNVRVTVTRLLPKAGAESMRYYEAMAFHVREEYTGPLLGLIWRSMPDLGPSSGRFAQGLKRRVETGR
jgi:hypothetical protein